MNQINWYNLVLTAVAILFIIALIPGAVGAADTTNISLSEASSTADTITYEIQLDNAENGVGTYTGLSVGVENSSVAKITSVTDEITGDTSSSTIASDGSSATWSSGIGGNTAQTGQVPIAKVTVKTDSAGTTKLNVTKVDVLGDEAGNPYSINNLGTTSIAVGETNTTSVILKQTSRADSQITYSVKLENATGGIGTFSSLTIKTNDTSVANITSVKAAHGGGTASKTINDDGSSATLSGGIGGDTINTGSAAFATVVVKTAPGKASISVDSIKTIGTEEGVKYTVSKLGTDDLNIGSRGPVFIDGGEASQDTDNDGRIEDLNGNGKASPLDAQTLYSNVDEAKKSKQNMRFDFNSDGKITALDSQALYSQLT